MRRGYNGVDDVGSVAAVFATVHGVDLVVEVGSGGYERDIFVDAASLDVAFVAHLCMTKPGSRAPIDRSPIEVVAEADDPNDYRLAQRAVAPE